MLRAGRWRRGVILALAITVGAVFVYLGLLADSLVLYLSPYGIPCILGGNLALSKAPFDSQAWKGNSPTGYDSGHPPSLGNQMARSLLDSYLRPGMSEAQALELLGEPGWGRVRTLRPTWNRGPTSWAIPSSIAICGTSTLTSTQEGG